MTALIADTSPILRNIPSDSATDRRPYRFSSTHTPARYLSAGQADRQSPTARGYNARDMTPLYPHGYGGYAVPDTFSYDDLGAPARIPRKSCRCQQRCVCSSRGAGSKSTSSGPSYHHQQQKHHQDRHQDSEGPSSSMWRKHSDANSDKPRFDRHQGGAAARFGSSAGPAASAPSQPRSPLAVSARDEAAAPAPGQARLSPAQPSSSPKMSVWENLLGAVDLELRAQEAEPVPEQPAAAVPRFSPSSTASVGSPYRSPSGACSAGRYMPSLGSAASVSPELGPLKPTHRRGGDYHPNYLMSAGGGPAYSGSTADAACLLATLPQRMLDRASNSPPSAMPMMMVKPTPSASAGGGGGGGGSGLSSPALVSASSPAAAPVRVQASGRRGPRGQSRFKGVCITRAGKWRAVIYIGRKQKYLGVFDSEFDAARAYDAAALQHFAEGAKLNFPDGVEQQLNEISSGDSGKPFATAGAGGAVAARSSTPPVEGATSARKRSRKAAFADHDDDEWVREGRPWSGSNRR